MRGRDGKPTGKITQVGIEDKVAKLNSALENISNAHYYLQTRKEQEISKLKSELKTDKVEGLSKLDDDLLAIAFSSAVDDNGFKATKTSRQVLPIKLLEQNGLLEAVKALKSYDEATQSVERGEFLEKVYTAKNISREKLVEILGQLNNIIKYGDYEKDEYEDENGNKIKHKLGKSEIARALSFRNFITKQDLENDFLGHVSTNVSNFLAGAVVGAGSAITGLLSFAEYVVPITGTTFRKMHDTNDDTWKQYKKDLALTSNSATTLTALGELGGMIGGNVLIGKGVGAVGKGSASLIGAIANSKNLHTGTKVAMSMMNAEEKAKVLSQSVNTFMNKHEFVGTTTALLADTISDAVIFNSRELREALSSGDKQTRDFMMGEFVSNSIGWGAFRTAGAGLKMAGKTKAGQRLNLKTSQFINGLSASVGDDVYKLKSKIVNEDFIAHMKSKLDDLGDGKTKDHLAKKIRILEQNQVLRQSKKNFAKASKEDVIKARSDLLAWQNAIDDMQRDATTEWTLMHAKGKNASGVEFYMNDSLGKTHDEINDFRNKLYELEKEHGLTPKEGLVSQEATDYMVGSGYLRSLDARVEANPLDKDLARKRDDIVEKVTNAKNRLPDDVVNLLDDNLYLYHNYYDDLNKYAIDSQVKNKNIIDEYKATGYWDDGYMHVEWQAEKPVFGRKDGKKINKHEVTDRSIKIDNRVHFVDPEITRVKLGLEIANATKMRKTVDVAKDIYGKQFKKLVTGSDTEIVRKIDSIKDSMYKELRMVTSEIPYGLIENGFKADAKAIQDKVDELVNTIKKNDKFKSVVASLKELNPEKPESQIANILIKDYYLKPNKVDIEKTLKKTVDDATRDLETISPKEVSEYKNSLIEEFFEALKSKVADMGKRGSRNIYKELNEIRDNVEQIEGEISKGSTRYISYLTKEGGTEFAEVPAPFTGLYNLTYTRTAGEPHIIEKVNALTAKMFRFGTTTLNLTSFTNQAFRDTGSALFFGGAFDTIKQSKQAITEAFGEGVATELERFLPSRHDLIELGNTIKRTGDEAGIALMNRELLRGKVLSPASTETQLYKGFIDDLTGKQDVDKILSKANNIISEGMDKVDGLMNGKRETYLRNRVFTNSYANALKMGYTIKQAREYATFFMNNATTNFSRQIYHLQAIGDSTPYFKAAINGSKSFWRIMEIDPVSTMTRIMGGAVIPTIYLTGMALSSEENRQAYKNLPEYQKAGTIPFAIGGQVFTIPLPQEMANLIDPIRQFIEHLHGTNTNALSNLLFNDLIGLSPINLQGFSKVDWNRVANDPSILDRMGRGVSRLFAQSAPVPVRSIYMMTTGIDPFTGKKLKDASYVYKNPETGEMEVMDYNQSLFVKTFAKAFGDGNTAVTEKILSGIIGRLGTDTLSVLSSIFTDGVAKAGEKTLETATERLTGPLTTNQYDYLYAEWRTTINELELKKKQMMNDKVVQGINNQLKFEHDPEKVQKLLAQRQNYVDDFAKDVMRAVKRLNKTSDTYFNRSAFASVIALLNFNNDPSWSYQSEYSKSLANKEYYNGRSEAISTLKKMGVKGTNDYSIFGYLKKNSQTGEVETVYNSPTAILDLHNSMLNKNNLALANIESIFKQSKLSDKKKAVREQISAIYNKGNLSNADFNKINAININWNAEVMKTIAPYIEKMTPEMAINNTQVMNLLEQYLEVPDDFKRDSKGRRVSNKKLGLGEAKRAYIRNFIKDIYNINDTGEYGTKRNFSDRR